MEDLIREEEMKKTAKKNVSFCSPQTVHRSTVSEAEAPAFQLAVETSAV